MASAVAAPPATWATAQPGVAGRDDAVLVGEDDSLDAVGEVELQEDEANAALHGRFRYDEPLFHRAVRESARDEYEHLPLAGRNVLEQRCRLLERVGAGGESPRSAGADLASESVEGPDGRRAHPGNTRWSLAGIFSGSDGIRTRDLRRDRSVRGNRRRPATIQNYAPQQAFP
jgi:hypothetical protein